MAGPTHHALDVLQAAMTAQGGTWTTDRAAALLANADLTVDQNSVWGLLRHITLNSPQAEPTWRQGALFAA